MHYFRWYLTFKEHDRQTCCALKRTFGEMAILKRCSTIYLSDLFEITFIGMNFLAIYSIGLGYELEKDKTAGQSQW